MALPNRNNGKAGEKFESNLRRLRGSDDDDSRLCFRTELVCSKPVHVGLNLGLTSQ
jgi:hypothetical protein